MREPKIGRSRESLEDTLMNTRINALMAALMLCAATLLVAATGHAAPPVETTSSVIVQAADAATASRLVAAMGGIVTHESSTIGVVGARLSAAQRDRRAGMQGVLRLYENGSPLVDAVDDQSFTVPTPRDPSERAPTPESRALQLAADSLLEPAPAGDEIKATSKGW